MKRQLSYVQRSALAIVAGLLIPLWAHGQAAARPQSPKAVPKAAAPVGAPTAPGGRPGQLVPAAPSAEVLSDQPAELAKPINATVGKSILLRFDEPLKRVSVGNPNIADVTLISRRELYLLGKAIGGTNVMLWGDSGRATVVDVSVAMDTAPLASQLRQTLPNEKDIRVEAAAGSVVLSGTVSGAAAVDHAVSLAEAYVRDVNRALVLPVVAGDAAVPAGAQVQIRTGTTTGGGVTSAVGTVGARVVNLLRVREGQQVMLEVKVAEVNRSLLDKLGVDLNLQSGTGAVFGIISRFFDPTAGGVLGWANGADFINIYAQRDDGLVKLLAEPNIVAISGQEASFLAGGTVFLPVPQSGAGGGPATITLQERDFGVSVKFLPTVLGNGRINLKVQPEVSEPLPQGLQVSTGGTSSTLPAFASRRASTTVQLNDGQSLAIAGLIRSNMAQTVNAFPVLGDLPVLGPLFRSTNFRNDKTELLFVITPRLVRPLPNNFATPTDRFVEPTRGEALVGSKMEGNRNYQKQLEDVQTQLDAPSSPDPAPAARQGGFEVK